MQKHEKINMVERLINVGLFFCGVVLIMGLCFAWFIFREVMRKYKVKFGISYLIVPFIAYIVCYIIGGVGVGFFGAELSLLLPFLGTIIKIRKKKLEVKRNEMFFQFLVGGTGKVSECVDYECQKMNSEKDI